MIGSFIKAMEAGAIPDFAIKAGIRHLLQQRLRELRQGSLDKERTVMEAYVEGLRASPVAVHTRAANEQHYELPSEFFLYSLGKNLKYSCCFWDETTKDLSDAEDLALKITMDRAQLRDGMKILELGCGWGSLSLKIAKTFPNSKIISISNSATQKAFIDERARSLGLSNLTVYTRDVSQLEDLAIEGHTYDRVVSVEMFEHFKNYEILLKRISNALSPGGKLFVHIFTHKDFAYPFEVEGEGNWMGRYFFTGGQMPSHHLLYHFQRDLQMEHSWVWDGTHYEKTCYAWLEKMDANKDKIMPLFEKTYGAEAVKWYNRWRVFYMSCGELFAFNHGQEWAVSHYLFTKR